MTASEAKRLYYDYHKDELSCIYEDIKDACRRKSSHILCDIVYPETVNALKLQGYEVLPCLTKNIFTIKWKV